MHHIYHTRGFILASINKGEANKMLTIYTREMGLIRAMAQGIRLQKSKLRFTLQDYSFANIDLVRGKDVWRVTSAQTISKFPLVIFDKKSLYIIARISKLLERLCHGEEKNIKIFDDLIMSLDFLNNENILNKEKDALELHLVLRIMNSLGYIGDSSLLKSYLEGEIDFNNNDSLFKERHSIIFHINKALNESQL